MYARDIFTSIYVVQILNPKIAVPRTPLREVSARDIILQRSVSLSIGLRVSSSSKFSNYTKAPANGAKSDTIGLDRSEYNRYNKDKRCADIFPSHCVFVIP